MRKSQRISLRPRHFHRNAVVMCILYFSRDMPGQAIKCGVQINPPSFVLIYKLNDRTKKKVMPVRNFKQSSSVRIVAEDLRKRHGLGDLPLVKIEKMLRLLQELLSGVPKEEAIASVGKEFQIKINEDLNKLSTKEIEFQKELMNSIFLKNQIKQGSNDFVYDKRIDFDSEKEKSNWDEDETDAFWD